MARPFLRERNRCVRPSEKRKDHVPILSRQRTPPSSLGDTTAPLTNYFRDLHSSLDDRDHYDPYALYGRLPMPGRGFPPAPAPHARHMFIGEWD
ncbi:unnamed protein product [Leptidea sinapis]|uniref:Uncharacterized protein n=1 Tax=Leptidea sinapis TaxID=189913 RepID=A0A5E4QAD4_9NEOP|nr:unnamed protein product [Leptidea sinapis]